MSSSAPIADSVVVEILSVEQAPELQRLEGAYLDNPPRGRIEGDQIEVSGWIIGSKARAVAVHVKHQGPIVRAARIDIERPDIFPSHGRPIEDIRAGFRAQVDVDLLPSVFELVVVALLEDGARARVGTIRGRHGNFSIGDPLEPPSPVNTPSLKTKLEELLNETQVGGIAADPLLDQLSFKGRKVLDLGSGLGHRSREAHARGATLVDGFERDPEQLRVARLLNAYHGTTRVSFFDRDFTDPESYSERYDVVLALSDTSGLADIVERIAAITGSTFVTELPGEKMARAALLSSVERAFDSVEVVHSDGSDRDYAIALSPQAASRQ